MKKKRPLSKILESSEKALKDKGIGTPRLDAELLLARSLNLERIYLLLYPSRELDQDEKEIQTFRQLIKRRAVREPVAYIIGEKEFWSLRFKTDPRALIPRPETELLVKCVLDHSDRNEALTGLDIGTGSGVISIALTKEIASLKMVALDSDPATLGLARENAVYHGVDARIKFFEGDLFPSGTPEWGKRFDFIVSNPPYVPSSEISTLEPEIKDYEPKKALDGGEDGLETITRLIKGSARFLKEGGFLSLEIGHGQAERVKELIAETGRFKNPQVFNDYSGIERVVLAKTGVRLVLF